MQAPPVSSGIDGGPNRASADPPERRTATCTTMPATMVVPARVLALARGRCAAGRATRSSRPTSRAPARCAAAPRRSGSPTPIETKPPVQSARPWSRRTPSPRVARTITRLRQRRDQRRRRPRRPARSLQHERVDRIELRPDQVLLAARSGRRPISGWPKPCSSASSSLPRERRGRARLASPRGGSSAGRAARRRCRRAGRGGSSSRTDVEIAVDEVHGRVLLFRSGGSGMG